MRFWNMPGPAGFLDEVLQSLAEGKNVVLAVPVAAAGDLDSALQDRLRLRAVDHVQVAGADPPVAQVARAVGIGQTVYDIDDLFADTQFTGSGLVYLQGLAEEQWAAWKPFIVDYDDLSKDRAIDQRPPLLAVLSGMDLPREVVQSVTFRGYRWLGRISELDITQYVLGRLEGIADGEGGRLLAAMIIAKVALGDVELADELAGRTVAEIWQPEDVLREWAGRHGWVKGTHRTWARGTVFRNSGRDEVHSALLALEDPNRIVQSRVWAAQAAMLLPGIERERLKLVGRARSYLNGPFQTADGPSVADARDLEIGPLEYQLRRRNAPLEVCRRAAELKDIRNKLAHMERLSVEESLYSGLL